MSSAIIEFNNLRAGPIGDFQVFGERRSGTNYIEQLIADNLLIAPTTKYGWKHGFPTMPCVSQSSLLIVVAREPVSWLSSLHNRPFSVSHRGLKFSEFIRREWYDLYRPKRFGHAKWGYGGMKKAHGVELQFDRHPITGKRFRNPMEMRNVKYASFLGFMERDCNVAVVDYGTANSDPLSVISEISVEFGIPQKDNLIIPGKVGPKGTGFARVTRDDINEDDWAFINDNLDAALEKRLGYSCLLEV